MHILFLILIIVYAAAAVYFAIRNDRTTIYFFMGTLLLQNITAILFYSFVPDFFITLFSLIKEIMLYLAAGIAIVKNWRNNLSQSFNTALVIYIIVVLVNFAITPTGAYTSIVALRYLAVPALCITVGFNLRIEREQLNSLMKFLVFFSAVLAVIGLIELFLLGDSFWTSIGYKDYAIAIKGNSESSIYNGVTVNFYTWDFGSVAVRRLVGITADPLASAYLLFLGALIIVLSCIKDEKPKKYFIFGSLSGIASLMVLSKAIFIFIPVVLVVLCYFYEWIPKKTLIRSGSVVCGVAGVALIIYLIVVDRPTSVMAHVKGLIDGFLNASMAGGGLGTAGVGAAMIAGAAVSTAESYIGTMIAQLGLIGVGAFLAYMLLIVKRLISLWNRYREKVTLLAITLMCGLAVCMLLSESSVSIMGTGIYFILIGIALRDDIYSEV